MGRPAKTYTAIHKQTGPNSILINLHSDLVAFIKSDEVVVKECGDEIHIREATLLDGKSLKCIGPSKQITYTSKNARGFIGKYDHEIEGDFIILIKREATT